MMEVVAVGSCSPGVPHTFISISRVSAWLLISRTSSPTAPLRAHNATYMRTGSHRAHACLPVCLSVRVCWCVCRMFLIGSCSKTRGPDPALINPRHIIIAIFIRFTRIIPSLRERGGAPDVSELFCLRSEIRPARPSCTGLCFAAKCSCLFRFHISLVPLHLLPVFRKDAAIWHKLTDIQGSGCDSSKLFLYL